MKREEILEAVRAVVRRTGKVPGRQTFEKETGIGRHAWYGTYWPTWGAVLVEAGFEANELNASAERGPVLAAFLAFIEEIGHFPTEGELRVRSHMDKGFPGRGTIERLGRKRERVLLLMDYATTHGASDAVQSILQAAAASSVPLHSEDDEVPSETVTDGDGFVYLMQSGRHFKIGRTNAVDRRQYEIGVQLPEKLESIHSIRTDDPSGIEAYWHNRFREKRLNGEWFKLSASDVRVFKRRKFM